MSKELIKPFLKGPIEHFCQLIAAGGKSQVECYLESHPNSIMRKHTAGPHATRLLKQPEVVARIHEIRDVAVAQVRKKIKYEMEDAFKELEQAYGLAVAQLDPKAMKAITELKAKLAGLVVNISEKRESQVLDDATTEELLSLREELKRQKMLAAGEPLVKAVEKRA